MSPEPPRPPELPGPPELPALPGLPAPHRPHEPERGVLFDLFGTLVSGDSDVLRDESSRRIGALFGVDPDAFAVELRRSFPDRFTGRLGDVAETLRTLAVRLGRTPTPAVLEAAVRERLELTRGQLVPQPGVLDALDRLRDKGFRLALVTNCSVETPTLWPETAFAERFDAAIFSSSLGITKPDPRIYRAALDAVRLPAEACVFIGDGAFGELPGAAAVGLGAILLESEYADPNVDSTEWTGPRIPGLGELPDILSEL